jgi:hypothetical protein
MARAATSLADTTGLSQLSGQPVVAVSQATLKAASSLIATWEELEPIVKALIGKVKAYAGDPAVDREDAAKLLSSVASVVQKVAMASTGVLRASEGMSKLALLLDVGRVQRVAPGKQTEKQLIGTVIEAVKRLVIPGKQCPACHALVPLEIKADA